MSLIDDVEKTLENLDVQDRLQLSEALAEAERMADEFADVKPVPYVVPIERYIGTAFQNEKNIRSLVK